MPLYDYECSCGSIFDAKATVDARHRHKCPDCGKQAKLVILTAPSLDYQNMAMDNGFPTAVSRWERDHRRRGKTSTKPL